MLTDTATMTLTTQGIDDDPLIDAGPSQTVDEGAVVQFQGSIIDPGRLLAFEITGINWDLGDGTVVTGTLTPTHTYADNAVYTVTLMITDNHGGVASDEVLVTVENVAPTLSVFPDRVASVGETITVTGTIADPGILDSQTVVITWVDGFTETLQLSSAQRHFVVTSAYAEAGEYSVAIRLTDKDNYWDEKSFIARIEPEQTRIYLPLVTK